MGLLRHLGLLVICASAWALSAGIADAKQKGNQPQPRGPAAVMFLEGSDGYGIALIAIDGKVMLEASRSRVSALYAVPGGVSAERLTARFGKLGRIAAEFQPIRLGRGRDRNGCRDRSPLQLGFFRGTIEFEGEDGYTALDEDRAFGIVLDPSVKPCPRKRRAGASAYRGPAFDTFLNAISKHEGTVTSFQLGRLRGESRLLLAASRQERRGRMQIFRQATTVVGGENAFAASGPGVRPPFAFVAAPKPFDGSALLEQAPEVGASPSWTGSLTAWLPGAGKVGPTGPDFATSFCRRAADERGCNPFPPVRSPFSALQGSGSHSQAFGDARLSWSRYLLNSASSAGSTP